jgi:hypothetical protein
MVPGFEDEKGKIFTEVVTKLPVVVMIQTVIHRLHGNIHIRPDERLKAELDRATECKKYFKRQYNSTIPPSILICKESSWTLAPRSPFAPRN